jgi:hypothetical protein
MESSKRTGVVNIGNVVSPKSKQHVPCCDAIEITTDSEIEAQSAPLC